MQPKLFNQLHEPVGFDVPALEKRLGDQPYFAFYSKSRTNKQAFASILRDKYPRRVIIYLCPKILAAKIKTAFPSFAVFALEDLTDKEIFFRIYDLVGTETVLIIENSARYALLTSDKFKYLHRLRKSVGRCYLIDIVPFTQDITKLYLPLSYLHRDILGYQHGYAFQYDYLETDRRGDLRRAHEPRFLGEKLSPFCWIDYEVFFPPMKFVNSTLNADERTIYAAKKTALFEKHDGPQKIVTALVDFAGQQHSRYASLAELLEKLSGKTAVYTNVAKWGTLVKNYLSKRGASGGIEMKTYMTHDGEPVEADNVVFFESPINQNRVWILDVIADLPPDAKVYYCRSDAKADAYVFGETRKEWAAIQELTKNLHGAQNESLS